MIRPAVRIALVVLGLAAIVYGTASLTGGWLGAPPWWERDASESERWDELARWAVRVGTIPTGLSDPSPAPPSQFRVPREGRIAMSGALVAAALACVTLGAWPKRLPEVVS